MFLWFLSISSPVYQTKFNNPNTMFLKQKFFMHLCCLIDHEFHYHITVKVAVDQGDSRVDQQTTLKNMTLL